MNHLRFRTLTGLLLALIGLPAILSAQQSTGYPLMFRPQKVEKYAGMPDYLAKQYPHHYLVMITFAPATHAAAKDGSNLQPGEGSWLDRGMRPSEPGKIRLLVPEDDPDMLVHTLKTSEGPFILMVKNSQKGFLVAVPLVSPHLELVSGASAAESTPAPTESTPAPAADNMPSTPAPTVASAPTGGAPSTPAPAAASVPSTPAPAVAGAPTGGASDPAPPTAKQVADWAVFATPAQLEATKMTDGDVVKMGDAVWVCNYADKAKATSYVIGLFKAGTLFGNNRAQVEKETADTADQFKQMAQQNPGPDSDKLAKTSQVQTRPDGRKVFFGIAGMSSSGGSIMAFTTIGHYDVLVEETVNSVQETVDTGNGQPAPPPSETKKDLPDVEQSLENYLGK